jgi:hypothetical protein
MRGAYDTAAEGHEDAKSAQRVAQASVAGGCRRTHARRNRKYGFEGVRAVCACAKNDIDMRETTGETVTRMRTSDKGSARRCMLRGATNKIGQHTEYQTTRKQDTARK